MVLPKSKKHINNSVGRYVVIFVVVYKELHRFGKT